MPFDGEGDGFLEREGGFFELFVSDDAPRADDVGDNIDGDGF